MSPDPSRAPGAAELDRAVANARATHMQGGIAAAEAVYEAVLRAAPTHFEALHLCGIAALQTGRPGRATELFTRAIAADPASAKARSNLAGAWRQLGEEDSALACFDAALRLSPGFPGAEAGRGAALLALGRVAEAVSALRAAVAADPGDAPALADLGAALRRSGAAREALGVLDRALSLDPGLVAAHLARGNVLKELGRMAEALQAVDRALSLQPGLAPAHAIRGTVLAALGQAEAALASYAEAIRRDPGFAEAHANRGALLLELDRAAEALEACETALRLRPGLPHVAGELLHARMLLCDWSDFADLTARIEAAIGRGESACVPGAMLQFCHSRAAQLRAARLFARPSGGGMAARPGRGRIRVAYVSADFGHHPVSYLMADVLHAHDRARFEVVGITLRAWDGSAFGQRLRAGFDRVIDASAMPDEAVVALARQAGIDLAIDLGGYTRGARPGLFAARLAPVQAAYLGYLGTTGSAAMDYLVADPVLVPEAHRPDYAERILALPHYQANSARPVPPEARASRREAGLPEQGSVFCCLNNSYKLTPEVFAGWMRILGRVPGSHLWLHAPDDTARRNLRAEAARHGIAPDRLVFAARIPREAYLARLGAADLFLDTQPYNAGTTASDALWMGVPVVTRLGETFAGRMAASVLTAIGLPELIAGSAAEYEALAVALATDPARHAALRARLAALRARAPLFDTPGFTRSLERGFAAMVGRHAAGLPPDHLAITG